MGRSGRKLACRGSLSPPQLRPLNKQDPAGSPSKLLTLADTQRIEGVLSKADKASNAKLFVEDKFSKNNISEASYAHQAIKSGSDCLTDLESQLESNYVPAIASSLELYRSYLRLSIAILTKKYSEAKVIANEVIANEPELSKAIPTEVITFIDEQLGASSPAE